MNLDRLNETSCRINAIKPGDRIPVGGTYPGKLDLTVTADIDNFRQFFERLDKNVSNMISNDGFRDWLTTHAPRFDATTFAAMYTFDNALRRRFPNLSKNGDARRLFYTADTSPRLSDAISAGVCQCAEIALLAQIYFEASIHPVAPATFFSGEIFDTPDAEFGDPHSFITIGPGPAGDYVYDPANPMPDTSQDVYFPRIQSIIATAAQKNQFEQKLHASAPGRKCAFFETRNIFTNHPLYYGAGDGGNLFPSLIISAHSPMSSATQPER